MPCTTVPGAPDGLIASGPVWAGVANQSPWVTGVPAFATGKGAVAVAPAVLCSSGSPGNGPKSNATGVRADADLAVTDTLWVIVGTIHSGGSALAASGSFMLLTVFCGASA